MYTDTIAAISTANGTGAISVIRLSGTDALSIASGLMKKDLTNVPGYTVHFGTVYENDEPVDEVLAAVFRAPRSYTGENVVEINCHGGQYITRKVLVMTLGAGARMAEPGEFTRRAFFNGKMDLSQAEAINDLILSRDALNARSAMHSMKGSVAKILEPLEEELTQIIANIEVNIDYPEYDDVQQLTEEEILPSAERWLVQIDDLIRRAEESIQIKEGIDTVILGKPNVGKSSLLNALLEEEKAIVTDIAGTTRDLVEGTVRLGDVTLNLIDTAGIHESEDVVERIGIERSLHALEKAQLAIVVLDDPGEPDEEEQALLELTKEKQRIIVYNKNDLYTYEDVVSISAKNGDIQALVGAVQKMYEKELLSANMDTLNNERQIGLAINARNAMTDAVNALKAEMELDLVTIDLQRSWTALKEITGKAGREDLLDEIFSRFCLGK